MNNKVINFIKRNLWNIIWCVTYTIACSITPKDSRFSLLFFAVVFYICGQNQMLAKVNRLLGNKEKYIR